MRFSLSSIQSTLEKYRFCQESYCHGYSHGIALLDDFLSRTSSIICGCFRYDCHSCLVFSIGSSAFDARNLRSSQYLLQATTDQFLSYCIVYVANSVTLIPFAVCETLVFGTIMYWMSGFVSSVTAFLVYILLLLELLTNLAFSSWFFFIAAVTPDQHPLLP